MSGNYSLTNSIKTVAGPVAALLAFIFSSLAGLDTDIGWSLAIALWCAIWWILEAVPIAVTAMLPLAIFPLVGVLTPQQVANAYGHPLILLLMGAFILAQALEASGAHKRVALGMVNLFGGNSPRRLLMGFMTAAALLSMWISNTATTLMLLPVMLAVLDSCSDKRIAVPLLLGTAYAASVGGLGTPIGTPPNLIFMSVYAETTGSEPGFVEWMSWGLPVVLVMVPIMMLWLTRNLGNTLEVNLPQVGGWRVEEKRVFIIFALTALAWMTRKEPFGGWSGWLELPQANDASVAMLAVVVLFLVPNGREGRLLTWQQAARIPWGVLILFGGGIALAGAFAESGLTMMIGNALEGLAGWHPWLLALGLCLAVTFLTEITSNTATTALLMPILAAAGIGAGLDPKLLMVPAVLSASCAFMLPVATAPNAVVYGSGHIRVAQMAREGFALNLIGAVVVSTLVYLLL